MSTIPQPRFYVYVLARPNGKPFYVGKGRSDRVFHHEREAKRGHKCHKCNIIRKIWRQGGEVQRYTVFTTDDEKEALDHEIDLIAQHKRGSLCNQTDGGEGASNPSEATRIKRSNSIKRVFATPEWKTAQSDRMKRHWQNPENRARRVAAQNKRYENPEAHVTQSNAQKRMWADPEKRAIRIATLKAAGKRPDVSAAHTAARHKRFADPNERAKMSATSKAAWADPEKRAKMLAARKRKGE